jgi:hypothetical protein
MPAEVALRPRGGGVSHRVAKAELLIRSAVGIGEDVRLIGEGISGLSLGPSSDMFTCAPFP